jgi:adenine-specific DNA-methyltransferase
MNKQDLISKIKQLDGITQDERAYLINLVNTKKKYGLVWEDKPEDVEEQLRDHLPVLKEVKDKAIINGEDNPNHILIEGDNLHALTALTFTHEGKIDVIYIDPPYNTGKENEFRYNDNWILKDHPFKHSNWINFISKRFKIAKRLLSETGVCIIHIDENEFDALNLFLETEVFSDDDFLGVIIWNKQNPKGDAKGVATMHEYVLVYAKNKSEFTSLPNSLLRPKPNAEKILSKAKKLFSKIGKTEVPEEIKEVIKPFNFSKAVLEDFIVKYDLALVNKEFQSWISKQDFSGGEKAYKFIDEFGKVYRGVSMAWPNKEQAPDDYFIPLIHPITNKPCPIPSRGWRNPSVTMGKLLDKNLILFGIDESKQPERKYLLEENMLENTPSIYNNGSSDDDLFKDLEINFAYPKPTSAAKYFLSSIHPNPKTILDFFAGSGTTLHATMALNAEDGGNRQCILVTNNENNICEEVTYERNKKVIQGYNYAKNVAVAGLENNNLRYFKSDDVSRDQTLKNKKELTRLATELLCIKENCYSPLTPEGGTKKPDWYAAFTSKTAQFIVIYDDVMIEDSIEIIKKIKENQQTDTRIKVYVFSNGQYPYTEDFEEVAYCVELCALPDAIYKAYQNVLPKTKREIVPTLDDDVATDENLFNQSNS